MPRRRIDPKTGEPELTLRERRLVDEYLSNGGHGARAAIDAGYSPKHAAQGAAQVLGRPDVKERIRRRLAQSRVKTEEVIGSLASQMRADVTDCFDSEGEFSIDLARKNGLGHLLKVSTTTRGKPRPDGSLRTTKIEFLPPQAAAVQLARLKQISDSKSALVDQSKLSEDEQQKLRIERIIASALKKFPHKTREEAIEDLGEIRPEFLPYLDDLPGPEAIANE